MFTRWDWRFWQWRRLRRRGEVIGANSRHLPQPCPPGEIEDSDSDGGHGDEERSSEPTLGIFPNHVHQVRLKTPKVSGVTETRRGHQSQFSASSPIMFTRWDWRLWQWQGSRRRGEVVEANSRHLPQSCSPGETEDSDSDGGHGDKERSSELALGIFTNHVHQVRLKTLTVTEVTEMKRSRRSQVSEIYPVPSSYTKVWMRGERAHLRLREIWCLSQSFFFCHQINNV